MPEQKLQVKLQQAYKSTFKTKEGRMVLTDLMAQTGFYGEPFMKLDHAQACALRDLMKHILSYVYGDINEHEHDEIIEAYMATFKDF